MHQSLCKPQLASLISLQRQAVHGPSLFGELPKAALPNQRACKGRISVRCQTLIRKIASKGAKPFILGLLLPASLQGDPIYSTPIAGRYGASGMSSSSSAAMARTLGFVFTGEATSANQSTPPST